ncbi:hypothetical protein EBR56_07675 [bacterium]|nr:hypothetical protein [bacterium]
MVVFVGPLCGSVVRPATAADVSPAGECDLNRKADIMHGAQWNRAIAELGGWLATQTVYPPAEVRRIKVRFNERVAAMSSYEIEYLLDSVEQKMRLLDTPEARDAKAWLGEYLSAMSDARRAQELRTVPNLLDMNAGQLWAEIQRIDRKRASLQQRQQGVAARQNALVDQAAASRQASAEAARATAARLRAAPPQVPARQGGGAPPFSDVPQRRMSIGVGPMGACIQM